MKYSYLEKMGVELYFSGDDQTHHASLGRDDVRTEWDDVSHVLTIHLDEQDATELFFDLMEIITKLHKDRR